MGPNGYEIELHTLSFELGITMLVYSRNFPQLIGCSDS